MKTLRALVDPTLDAILGELTPLRYSGGASPADDLPGHVRAASALRRTGGRLVIVQDDVNGLVLQGELTRAMLLPAGEGGRRTFDSGRGNKHAKMDLEACAALPDGRLVAFGSGSSPARERLVVVREADLQVVDAPAFYALLRAEPAFAGSELNLEGVLVVGEVVRLFQRGNGARKAGLSAVNATADVSLAPFVDWLDHHGPLPSLNTIVQYDLGSVEGVPFTFTDAALMLDGRVAFVACVEASPNTVRDGEVLGCRFGIIDGEDVRVTDIRHADGTPTRLKLEGIESRPDGTFDVVVDMDRPDEPAQLGQLTLRNLRKT